MEQTQLDQPNVPFVRDVNFTILDKLAPSIRQVPVDSFGDFVVSIHRDVAEALSFQYKTTGILRLIENPKLVQNDKFLMYCLAQALPTARAYNCVMVDNQGDFTGIEYKQPDREKYAFVLPDASRPGKWRVSFFDAHGFSYHEVAATASLAAQDMVTLGFTQKAAGSLDRLAATRQWSHGIEFADLLMRLNMGQIPHAEFVRLSQALNDKFNAFIPEPAALVALEEKALA